MKTEENETLKRAFRILGARDMSRNELIRRLVEKGESEEDAIDAVSWLEERGFVDDSKYAGMITRHYAARGYGEKRIRQELYRRLIPRELWDEVIENNPLNNDKLDSFLRSRLSASPDKAEIKKVSDALIRRGFSWGEIKDALARFNEDE